jgi:hypothetical protein
MIQDSPVLSAAARLPIPANRSFCNDKHSHQFRLNLFLDRKDLLPNVVKGEDHQQDVLTEG